MTVAAYPVLATNLNMGRALRIVPSCARLHVTGRTYISGLICFTPDDEEVEGKRVRGFVEGRRESVEVVWSTESVCRKIRFEHPQLVSGCLVYRHERELPIPVAARSKVRVCGRSLAEFVVSNPAVDMDVCLL